MLFPTHRSRYAFLGLLVLAAALLFLLPDAAADNNHDKETDVADTFLIINKDRSSTSGKHKLPVYHDLVVMAPDTVTFCNIALFRDMRDDDGTLYMLEIMISSNSEEEVWFTTTYYPSYTWADRICIDQKITEEGPNPEEFYVATHYTIYYWDDGVWVEDYWVVTGDYATVYKIINPIG